MNTACYYDPETRQLRDFDTIDFDHDEVTRISLLLAAEFEGLLDEFIWVVFGPTTDLRVFWLSSFPPSDSYALYLQDIKRLVDQIPFASVH